MIGGGGCEFLRERKGETDPHRQWLAFAYPWLRGILALHKGSKKKTESFFLLSHKRTVKDSSHLGRVYVSIFIAAFEFEKKIPRRPEEAILYPESVPHTSHDRPGCRTEMETLLLLALLHAGNRWDPEVSAMYLLRALESVRKKGIADLLGQGSQKLKTELDRLFGLA